MPRDDARNIRAMLQDRLDELLAKLLPGGRRDGGLYVVKNPTRDDRKAGSFVIWLNGAAKGGFKDYAGGEADKGDVIDMIGYVHRRKADKKFALDWARDFLGLKTMDPKARQAAQDAARAKALQSEKLDQATAFARRQRAFRMFDQAAPIAGTLAERYFEAREIPLQLIPNLEADMRFMPRLEWWKGATFENGRKTKAGPFFPAIVSAIRNINGELLAVHCTFLRADGGGKAAVDRPKLMFGTVAGGVIRLARGPSNQTPEEAALSGRRDTVVICEGIETGLSMAIAVPDARVWAATSLSNIANVPVWHACVLDVVVAADNPNMDASPAGRVQAAEQLEKAMETLSAHGVPVVAITSHHGNDFNDLIRGD